MRGTETDIWKDRQTHRLPNRQTDYQTEKQTDSGNQKGPKHSLKMKSQE